MSVILEDADHERLEPFLSPETAEHVVLQDWVSSHGGRELGSDAAVIRALMHAGASALHEQILDVGYAELAVLYDNDDADAERRTARRRHLDRTKAAP
ncbi:MAG: hypothetical protein WKF54_10440 [Nocardioidaceae bacterium]